MNEKTKNLIILILGLIVYSILHVSATYGYRSFQKQGKKFWWIFIVCLFLGTLSYIIKIPLFYFFAKDSAVLTYILYITVLAFVVTLYSKFILHETIELHTYIILVLILGLVILNHKLSSNP
jgi:hypothetical protein